jgi:hypothetical protein
MWQSFDSGQNYSIYINFGQNYILQPGFFSKTIDIIDHHGEAVMNEIFMCNTTYTATYIIIIQTNPEQCPGYLLV